MLKPWHYSNLDPQDVLSLADIVKMAEGRIAYSALRSYATHRRTHKLYGPMPAPVSRVANRSLWLRWQIDWWLTDPPFPAWQRHKARIDIWKRGRAGTMMEWETPPEIT